MQSSRAELMIERLRYRLMLMIAQCVGPEILKKLTNEVFPRFGREREYVLPGQAWTIKRATTTKRATGNFEGRSQPRPATIYISLLFRSMNYTKNPGVHRY